MLFFKKLFDAGTSPAPVEPIFPGEHFVHLTLDTPDGPATVTINKAYNHYPNKAVYAYHVLVELEAIHVNDAGYAAEVDTVALDKVEIAVMAFLQRQHTVHLVGRVNRKNFRDLLIYMDEPRLQQDEVTAFCNSVMIERAINFTVEKDIEWNAVGGFLE